MLPSIFNLSSHLRFTETIARNLRRTSSVQLSFEKIQDSKLSSNRFFNDDGNKKYVLSKSQT